MWPLRSSRQRIRSERELTQSSNGMSAMMTSEFVVDRNYRIPNKDCVALLAVLLGIPNGNQMGVVKPHGRLGPLRLEWIAPGPRAAYRRSGLLRPFRRVEPSEIGRAHV